MTKLSITKYIPKRNSDKVARPTALVQITNDNLSEHRSEMLKGARKFIYPLQKTKHKVVIISSAIALISILGIFVVSMLGLYRYQSTSQYYYNLTKAIPFFVAKVGNKYVRYEEYLFEFNHLAYYYTKQNNADFTTVDGKNQLVQIKKQSLDRAVNNTYVRVIAKENNITVTDAEVEARINMLKDLSLLGANQASFEKVLQDFYGWTKEDFSRSIKNEILSEKVVDKLDTASRQKADEVLQKIAGGQDFAQVAKDYSEDTTTKDNGGLYGYVSKNTRDLSPQVVSEIFKLGQNSTSGIINTGYTLEIIKNLEIKDETIKLARISIARKNIDEYINAKKETLKSKYYINIK